jgi:hypothetical protein
VRLTLAPRLRSILLKGADYLGIILMALSLGCLDYVLEEDLLAPVYAWFTEGFDTANLKEAKALLDELT